MLKTVLRYLAIIVALGLAAGAWIFVHPNEPDPAPVYEQAMLPAAANSGIYQHGEGQWLALPGLEGGITGFPLNGVDRGETLDPEVLPVFAEEQPYTVSDFDIEAAVHLDGWLFEPASPVIPDKAALVILHGSGSSDRSNAYYISLADRLTRSGYVVVLPDKRGSGRSGGDWRNLALLDLAEDGAALMSALRERVNAPAYGFIGVSQGGSIAPDAARLSGADFAVSIGSAMTDFDQQLHHEISNDVAASGVPNWLRGPIVDLYTWRARRRQPGFWSANGSFRPPNRWQLWRGPWFVAYGSEDEFDNVPVERSAEILASEGQSGTVSYRVYDGGSHGILLEDGDFAEAFIADMIAFIDANTPHPQ